MSRNSAASGPVDSAPTRPPIAADPSSPPTMFAITQQPPPASVLSTCAYGASGSVTAAPGCNIRTSFIVAQSADGPPAGWPAGALVSQPARRARGVRRCGGAPLSAIRPHAGNPAAANLLISLEFGIGGVSRFVPQSWLMS